MGAGKRKREPDAVAAAPDPGGAPVPADPEEVDTGARRRADRRSAVGTAGSSGAGASSGSTVPPEPSGPALETRNEVVLVGRVAAPAEERTLPSGDVITTWRVVVDRPRDGRPLPAGVRTSSVDTLNCVAWRAGPRRTARGLVAGDVVEVSGALRRRFWRAGGGPVSVCEVEVSKLTRLARAAPVARR